MLDLSDCARTGIFILISAANYDELSMSAFFFSFPKTGTRLV